MFVDINNRFDLVPPRFDSVEYILGNQLVILNCVTNCTQTRLIVGNITHQLLLHDPQILSVEQFPLKLVTQSKTFTLDFDLLMGEREEHLNNKIVADRQLMFSYLDINSVFESLEFEELLEFHANDLIHMLKTSKIVQGITGLVLFLIVFIITFTTVWCCRRKCDRCFCAQLTWWQLLLCFWCGTKQPDTRDRDYLRPRQGAGDRVQRTQRSPLPEPRYRPVAQNLVSDPGLI